MVKEKLGRTNLETFHHLGLSSDEPWQPTSLPCEITYFRNFGGGGGEENENVRKLSSLLQLLMKGVLRQKKMRLANQSLTHVSDANKADF